MIKAYLLAQRPTEGAMYALGLDKIEISNAYKAGQKDDKDIILVVCNDDMFPAIAALPEFLGGNDADLALRHPDLARQILTVEVKTSDGKIAEVAYGAVTADMVALSPAKEPIVIMGEDLNQQRRSEC